MLVAGEGLAKRVGGRCTREREREAEHTPGERRRGVELVRTGCFFFLFRFDVNFVIVFLQIDPWQPGRLAVVAVGSGRSISQYLDFVPCVWFLYMGQAQYS